MAASLFKGDFEFFLTERLDIINRTWLVIIIFISIAKKRPVKNASTTFLFREVEQIAVYQLISLY